VGNTFPPTVLVVVEYAAPRMRWAVLALVLAVLATYASGLRNDFLYDDHEVFLAQPTPRSLGDLARLFAEPHFHGLPYWRPLVRASLLAQKAVHGERPLPFHAANALIAAGVAVATYALLRAPRLAVRAGPAWLAAALFAVHPIASSAVHPIDSGRETLLPALCVLASVAAFLHGGARGRALSLAFFALALTGKEASVVVPPLLLLADVLRLPPDPPRGARDWIARHAPGVLLLAGYLALRAAILPASGIEPALLEAPLRPLLSLLFALQVQLAPFRELRYEPELAVWWSPLRLALAGAVVAALAAGAAARWRELRAPALFFAGWWLLTLLPTANLRRQDAFFDERYAFLALLAPLGLAACLASRIWDRPRARAAIAAGGAALVLAAALVSAERAASFRDDFAFAEAWLRTDPDAAEARHALGVAFAMRGQLDEALPHYRAAVQLHPEFSDARANLGAALAWLGRPSEAREELVAALRLDPRHPEAHNNLGLLLAADGRLAEAERHYRAALVALPRFAEAENNLGTALARQGRLDEAIPHFETALRLRPGYGDALGNLELARARRDAARDAAP
jgi:Flp pilus assembly protein TadD